MKKKSEKQRMYEYIKALFSLLYIHHLISLDVYEGFIKDIDKDSRK
jgi:hypothetical protein